MLSKDRPHEKEKQLELLRRWRDSGLLKGEADRIFHELLKLGDATHGLAGNQRMALSGLKYARALGILPEAIASGKILGCVGYLVLK